MSDNPLSQDTSVSLVERAKAIIVAPKEEWPRIAAEPTSQNDVLLKYALPLIAIGPICTLIGSQVFGYGGLGFHIRPSLGFSIGVAITSFVMGVVGLFVITFIANFLATRFGGKQNWLGAFKLVAYSMTAAWVAGVFGLIPMLGILAILGLYSIYLFYLGSSRMLGVPEDQAGGYTAVTIIASIVVLVILGAISGAVTGSFAAASMSARDDVAVSIPGMGEVTSSGSNSTIEMPGLGTIQINEEDGTMTIDGNIDGQDFQAKVNTAE